MTNQNIGRTPYHWQVRQAYLVKMQARNARRQALHALALTIVTLALLLSTYVLTYNSLIN